MLAPVQQTNHTLHNEREPQFFFAMFVKKDKLSDQKLFGYTDLETLFCLKMCIYSYPSVLTHVFGVQKNRLIETVLLSTHNICLC